MMKMVPQSGGPEVMEKMMRSENEPLEPKITSIGKGKSSSKPSFFGFHVNFAGCRVKIIFEHVPQHVVQ